MLIGVYRHLKDPVETMPEERTRALAAEALVQGVDLVFFSSAGVDFSGEKVEGKVWENGRWRTKKLPFPDVLLNELPPIPSKRSETEKRLRSLVPVTTFLIDRKEGIFNKMNKAGTFADLIIPYKKLENVTDVFTALEEQEKVVIKPSNGRQGKGIYFILKEAEKFILQEHTEKTTYTKNQLEKFLKEGILKKDYFLQPYICCKTNNGSPFDFRAHVQRNGEGNWEITKIYPRIGNNESILSNVSRGGYISSLDYFLHNEFPANSDIIKEKLERYAIELAEHINSFYKFKLDELGIDLAIDEKGKFWLYEVNTGPQTKYHEAERAVRTIAYAKYVGSQANNRAPVVIGMLCKRAESTKLKKLLAAMAGYKNATFYYFRPEDINYDEKKIYGFTRENGKWVQKAQPYPDVVYDKLKNRSSKLYTEVYSELAYIPFTNERNGGSASKSRIFNLIKEKGKFEELLIPYKIVKNYEDITNAFDQYGKIIIKPVVSSYGLNVFCIEKQEDKITVVTNGTTEEYSFEEFEKFLRPLIEKYQLFVQPFISSMTEEGNPFDLRVHLMKDSNGKWSIVKKYFRVGQLGSITSNITTGGFFGKFKNFVDAKLPQVEYTKFKKEINSVSIKFANHFEEIYKFNIDEMGLDFGIDEKGRKWLFEVNLNEIGRTDHEIEAVEHTIDYAIYLGKK